MLALADVGLPPGHGRIERRGGGGPWADRPADPGTHSGHYAFVGSDVALIRDAADSGPDGELRPFTPRQRMTDPAQADAPRAMLTARPWPRDCRSSRLPVRMFGPGHSPAAERRIL